MATDQELETPHRRRNARGEGARLAEEIVEGALALIEQTGTEESVTLRAVARQVGIAAPSIYAHFADRRAIMLAVVGQVFDELSRTVAAALDQAGADPVERLVAGCGAYVAFGLAHPSRYGVLFAPERRDDLCEGGEGGGVELDGRGRPVLELGGEAFDLLADGVEACVAAGRTSVDVFGAATLLWSAMHGTVTLQSALPGFPFPDQDHLVRSMVLRLAQLA